MAKIWIEICLISARGVRGSSPSLWKRHWYAVGWVDPKSKYCTKVDASGKNANPVWRTKFAVQVDDDSDLASLHVEVYSRDPVFLTQKLHGSATVVLREFLAKKNSEEAVGSYQLRKNKSNKPRGFIDVSIRVCEDKEDPNNNFHPQGDGGGGIVLLDYGNSNNSTHLTTEGGFGQAHPQQKAHQASLHGPENKKQAQTSVPYYSSHPVPFPADYATDPYVGGSNYAHAGPSYQPPRTTSTPPPPPSNFSYAPNFFPSSGGMAPSYFNMPTSSSSTSYGAGPRPRGPPGFAIGAGAGALAAGAVMFGDNFM